MVVFPLWVPFVSVLPQLRARTCGGHPAPSPPRWTKVVYYFLLRVARQSRGPALPPVQSARWESPPFRGARAATGWGSCQSSGHPARMQQEYWGRDHQSGGGVTFSINKMWAPPPVKRGGGGAKHYPALGPHRSRAG